MTLSSLLRRCPSARLTAVAVALFACGSSASDSRVSQLARSGACRIVVEGDSISAVPSPVPGVTSLPDLLSLPPSCTVQVTAVSGTQTAAMVGRFDAYKDAGFTHFIVLGGINDLRVGTPLDQVRGNLDYMWREAAARGMRVVAVTTTPEAGESSWTDAKQALQDELNAWIRQRASAKGYALVDAWKTLLDPARPNRLAPALDAGDGLHPNSAGQRALAVAMDAGLQLDAPRRAR